MNKSCTWGTEKNTFAIISLLPLIKGDPVLYTEDIGRFFRFEVYFRVYVWLFKTG